MRVELANNNPLHVTGFTYPVVQQQSQSRKGIGYVEFLTAASGRYDGLGYYVTAAIPLEHLRPADGKPLGREMYPASSGSR